MGCAPDSSLAKVCHARIAHLVRQEKALCCVLENQTRVRLPRFLASQIAIGDDIIFPILTEEESGAEVYILKAHSCRGATCLYLAPIEFVTQQKFDKRDQSFVTAQIRGGSLGISSLFCPVKRFANISMT